MLGLELSRFQGFKCLCVLMFLSSVISACGGSSDNQAGKSEFFSITLSDNFDMCGSPIAQTVSVSFFNSSGEESAYSIEHSGLMETYEFEDESFASKDLRLQVGDRDLVILEVDPTSRLYFNSFDDSLFSEAGDCACSQYNITFEGSSDEASGSILWVGGAVQLPTSSEGGVLSWQNVSVCELEQNSVYIANNSLFEYAKVDIGESENILVSNLGPMSSIEIGGIPPEYLASFDSQISAYFYSYDEVNQDLALRYNYSLDPVFSDTIYYPGLDSISDLTLFASYPLWSADFSSTVEDSMGSVFTLLGSVSERLILNRGISQLSSDPAYEVFDIEDLNVVLSQESISISLGGELPFDAALLGLYRSGLFDLVQVMAPIREGSVDLSGLQNLGLDIDQFYIVVIELVDYSDAETYLEAVSSQFSRREGGVSRARRSVSAAFFSF